MSGALDDGGPAFPVAGMTGLPNGEVVYGENGMTLRDYFAAKAMQGMLADLPKTLYGLDWQTKVTESSYEIADAMLKARQA